MKRGHLKHHLARDCTAGLREMVTAVTMDNEALHDRMTVSAAGYCTTNSRTATVDGGFGCTPINNN